jgi:hypothetical protein
MTFEEVSKCFDRYLTAKKAVESGGRALPATQSEERAQRSKVARLEKEATAALDSYARAQSDRGQDV